MSQKHPIIIHMHGATYGTREQVGEAIIKALACLKTRDDASFCVTVTNRAAFIPKRPHWLARLWLRLFG